MQRGVRRSEASSAALGRSCHHRAPRSIRSPHTHAPIRMLSPFLALPAHFTRTRVPTRGSYLFSLPIRANNSPHIWVPAASESRGSQDAFFFYHPPSTISMGNSKGKSASKAKQPAITQLARPLIKVAKVIGRADRRERVGCAL